MKTGGRPFQHLLDMENVIFEPQDKAICESLLAAAAKNAGGAKPLPEIVVALARHFTGTPYCLQDSGSKIVEYLVVNLHSFDCVTFVENVIALALAIQSGKTDFADYFPLLEKIRYRDGRINGYPSRLHYFTDWIWDNGRKGILIDVTTTLGGIPVKKRFSFITSDPGSHPPLLDEVTLKEMRHIEEACSHRAFHYIPKLRWREVEGQVEDGDIIAITSGRENLDVMHTGFALRANGKIHLLHASSKTGNVVLSESTLNRYLRQKGSRTGVIVARLAGRRQFPHQSSENSSPIMVSSKATSR